MITEELLLLFNLQKFLSFGCHLHVLSIFSVSRKQLLVFHIVLLELINLCYYP